MILRHLKSFLVCFFIFEGVNVSRPNIDGGQRETIYTINICTETRDFTVCVCIRDIFSRRFLFLLHHILVSRSTSAGRFPINREEINVECVCAYVFQVSPVKLELILQSKS